MKIRNFVHQWRRQGLILASCLASATMQLVQAAPAQDLNPQVWFAPYQHVALNFNAETSRIHTSVSGQPEPLIRDGRSILPARIETLIWGFASGECGQEVWGQVTGEQFAKENVADFVQAGLGYVLSTGGQAAMFSCGSDQGMASFIQRYDSPMLRGVDFDIEGQQSDQQIEQLVLRARYLRQHYPHLRLSFTLATHAGSDQRRASLNRTGEKVVHLIKQHQLDGAIINLMVMDFGKASSKVCVLRGKRCDMGKSAWQAVQNVSHTYQIPVSQIAVTAMIGVNDVLENVFDLNDARQMLDDARQHAYAGVHFWSLDRDRSCQQKLVKQASPVCHGMPGLAPLTYSMILNPRKAD